MTIGMWPGFSRSASVEGNGAAGKATAQIHAISEFVVSTKTVHAISVQSILRQLRDYDAQLARPRVDTLNGSRHTKMKELRFGAAGGEWRVAFDPLRRAVFLVAGDKSVGSERRCCSELIRNAYERFGRHLACLAGWQKVRSVMALDVEDVIDGLEYAERRKLEEMAAEPIAEEMSSRELRKPRWWLVQKQRFSLILEVWHFLPRRRRAVPKKF